MLAKKGASVLLGCYRTGDANDPETYVAAAVAVLSRYDDEVIEAVTDVATGLPAKLKWLPSIAEIRDECDMIAARIFRREERERQIREQFALRDRPQLTDGRPRKTYEQLKAELAEVGIFIGPKGADPIDIGAFRKKYGITQEQWNAIPDAKKQG